MDEKRLMALVATGAVVSGAAVGFLLGSRFCKKSVTDTLWKAREHKPLIKYVFENGTREPEVITKLIEVTEKFNVGNDYWMLSDSFEKQFFTVLLKSINAKKAIEVGVYTGTNLINMALALPDDGKVVGCELLEEFVAYGKPFFKEANVEHKIDLRIQPATQTLDELLAAGEAGTFDFIFIDADKVNYGVYYEKSLELVRQGGIIAIDNTLYAGKVWHPVSSMDALTAAIHALNQKIHKDSRVDMCMMTIADGVTLVRKR